MFRILILVMLLFPSSCCQAAEPKMQILQVSEENNMEEYEKVLIEFKKWSDNFEKQDFHKNVVLKRHDKEIKYSNFSNVEKNLYIIWSGERCSAGMLELRNKWVAELLELVGDDSSKTKLETLSTFVADLHQMRKSHAKKLESVMEKIFSDLGDEIPNSDKIFYMKRIKSIHKKLNLTDS